MSNLIVTNVEIYDEENYKPAIVISWDGPEGFGEVALIQDGHKILIQSENMGKGFVKELLCQLVDQAELVG